MMNTTKLILLNRLKSFDGLAKDQITAIQFAMSDYALKKVSEYRDREIKSTLKSGTKLFFSLRWDNIVLWLRERFFRMARKNAQSRANTENRKVYVIRKSLIGYKLLSTKDVNYNKRIRVLRKDVDALKLAKTADFIAYPKK